MRHAKEREQLEHDVDHGRHVDRNLVREARAFELYCHVERCGNEWKLVSK